MEAAIIVVLVVVFAILVVMMIIALGSRRKDSKTISFESKTTDEPKQLTQQEKSGNYQAQGGFNFAPAKKEEAVLPGQELKTSATAAIPTAAQPASQPTAHIDAPSASAASEKSHEDPEPVGEAAAAEPETLTVEAEAKPEEPVVVTKKPEKETEKEEEPVAVVTETAEDSESETKPEEPETEPEEPEGEKPDAKSEAAENEEQPEVEPVDDEPVENQSAVAEPEADDAAGVNAETVEDRSAKKPVETDEVQPAKKPAAEDEPEKEEVKEEVAEAPQPEEQPEPSKPGRQKRNKPQKRQKQRGKKQQSRAAAQEKPEEAVAADEASEKPQKSDSDTTKDHKEEPAPQNAQSDRDEQAKDVADTELEGSFEKLDEFHELVEELPDSEEIPVVEQAEPEDVDKQDALEAAAATAVVEAADKARAETPAPVEKPKPADAEPKPQDTIEPAVGRIGKLRGRLSKSQNVFGRSVLGMLSAGDLDDDAWEDIETQLIQADLGVKITTNVVDELREMIAERGVSSEDEARAMLRECLIAACKPELDRSIKAMPYDGKPAVVLVVGVNGTGKTTTTGKLARVLVSMGHKVLLGAADTFRAAAADQLEAWGRRVGATTVRGAEAADPASVAFDAVSKGVETHADVVLIDTAGRLHNSTNLMDQLRKVKRVVEKKAVVDEVLLVLDATTGQNGLVQAKTFGDVVNITGVVLTKLDGTAKGGIVFQVQEDLGVPVKLVGLGEGADDLAPFEVEGFVDALLG